MKHVIYLLLFFTIVSHEARADSQVAIVKNFVNAFNEKDIDAMLLLASKDIAWYSVSGGNITKDTSSQSELKDAMLGYFKHVPSASSKLLTISKSGSFVQTIEQAKWLKNNEEKSQCSLAIYEFDTNKIKNVWYFPSHQCSGN